MHRLYKYVYHIDDRVYAIFDIVHTFRDPIEYLDIENNGPIRVYACQDLRDIASDYTQVSWEDFREAYSPNLSSIVERLYKKD